jgi:hypothetical protein
MAKRWVRAAVSIFAIIAFVDPSRAAVTVFSDLAAWTTAVGAYQVEDFTDATLNPGITVITNVGEVNTTFGAWVDNVAQTGTNTTWTFAAPIYGFGGSWDLAGWGGPGQGLAILLDGALAPQEINRDATGQFFGVISTTPFSQVYVRGGTQQISAVQESYALDNMVYSVPEPTGLITLAVAVPILRRRRSR